MHAKILLEFVKQNAANQIPFDGGATHPAQFRLKILAVKINRHVVRKIWMAQIVNRLDKARLLFVGVEGVRVVDDLQTVLEGAGKIIRQNFNFGVKVSRANRKIFFVARGNDFDFVAGNLRARQNLKLQAGFRVDVAISNKAVNFFVGRIIEHVAQINFNAAQQADFAINFTKIFQGVAPKISFGKFYHSRAKCAIIFGAMENKIYKITKSEYVASAVKVSQYPAENLPEIVFIGRSNVGKSSLINSLTSRRNLARISQTPGKTQTINFYRATISLEPPQDFHLVDLPGYGYAKVSKDSRRVWAKFIEEFLTTSRAIKFVCQLVDFRHPPMDSDLKMLAWLVENNLPVLIVATKADKLSKNERAKNLAAMKKSFGIDELPILPHSSKTGEGSSELLDVIAESLLE